MLNTVPMQTGDPASHLFRLLEGGEASFVPIQGDIDIENAKLVELIVPSDSAVFPGPEFASSDDGHFHSGDIFEEVFPERFQYRGRMDDWIKMSNATRCDTKAIEDHLWSTCSDLISECVVVGSGRVCPAIFVVRNTSFEGLDGVLKREIVSRSQEFNSKRYTNERVLDEELIFLAGGSELPRTATKGNVRRKAVEEKYVEVLDGAYANIVRITTSSNDPC